MPDYELMRVRSNIAPYVKEFIAARRPNGVFSAEDLYHYVKAAMPYIAPDSPNRIMRELRRTGEIGYRVVNRRDSLYQVTEGGEIL